MWQNSIDAFITEYQLSGLLSKVPAVSTLISGIAVIFTLPIIYLSAFAPSHTIWLFHTLEPKKLLQESWLTLRNFAYTSREFSVSLIRSLLLIIGSALFIWIIYNDSKLVEYKTYLYIASLLPLFIAVRFALLTFISFTASVATQLDPLSAVVIAFQTIKTKIFHIVACVAAGSVFYLVPFFFYQLTGYYSGTVHVFIITISVWYILSTLLVLTFEGCEDFAWQNGRTFRPDLGEEAMSS